MEKNLLTTQDDWAIRLVSPWIDRNIHPLDCQLWQGAVRACKGRDGQENGKEFFCLSKDLIATLRKKNRGEVDKLACRVHVSFKPSHGAFDAAVAKVLRDSESQSSDGAWPKYMRDLSSVYWRTVHHMVLKHQSSRDYMAFTFGLDERICQILTRMSVADMDAIANGLRLPFQLRYQHWLALESLQGEAGNDSHFRLAQVAQSLSEVEDKSNG